MTFRYFVFFWNSVNLYFKDTSPEVIKCSIWLLLLGRGLFAIVDPCLLRKDCTTLLQRYNNAILLIVVFPLWYPPPHNYRLLNTAFEDFLISASKFCWSLFWKCLSNFTVLASLHFCILKTLLQRVKKVTSYNLSHSGKKKLQVTSYVILENKTWLEIVKYTIPVFLWSSHK